MKTQIISPYTRALQEENISRLGLFLKKNLSTGRTSSTRKKKEVTKILYEVVRHPSFKKYLDKKLFFTQDFVSFIGQLHAYMKAFRTSLSFEGVLYMEQFPLFLLGQYSSPEQKDIHSQLIETHRIQECIEENGLPKAKKVLSSLLDNYQKSFSSQQLFSIQQILELGKDFQVFLQYDLTDLLLMLYPPYLQDKSLSFLSTDYKPISSSSVIKELKAFLPYFSSLKKNAHYYPFIDMYGKFFGKKIISYMDFEKFFLHITEFSQDDVLLNLLRVQMQDELFRASLAPHSSKTIKFAGILEHIASDSSQKQETEYMAYAQKMEETLLEYLFDKSTITKIQEQQKIVDQSLKKNHEGRSLISLCIVLTAFNTKIYNNHITPNFQFLLKHATFLLPEFKKDLTLYIQATTTSFHNAQEVFEKSHKAIKSSQLLSHALELEARNVCQNFTSSSQNLLRLLRTIVSVGEEDLHNNLQFVIPRDTMEKLLRNLKVAQTLLEKVDNYVQTLTQVSTIF